ncbi:MAG: hypothetical protein KIT11_06260 [Fimbriimonadaceae bacterium]|nr:hypothetical protein [Fimbriimonadaceae bacterium]QYK55960.1 MAG: hypothetical protein KF733_00450 [Fimbriimonadaceae bacterium]
MPTFTIPLEEAATALRSLSQRLIDLEAEASRLGLLLTGLPDADEPPAPLTDAKLKVWVDNLVARRLETKKSLNFSILVYGFYHHKFQALDGWLDDLEAIVEFD